MRSVVILLGMSALAAVGAQRVEAQHRITATATVVAPLQASAAPVQVHAAPGGMRATLPAAPVQDSRVLEKAVIERPPVREPATRTWQVQDGAGTLLPAQPADRAGVTVTRYVFANS